MKKKTRVLIILGVVAVLVIAAVVGVLLLLSGGHRVIKIEDYKGDVELERDGDEVDIFEGIKLRSEDEITTGERSQAELLCDDDKHILARENTCFTIISKGNKKEGKLEIELLYGATLIDIENKLPDDYDFEVSTPNACLSVRGTTFEAMYDPDTNTTTLNVTEGKVKVESDIGEVVVEKGHEVVVTGTALLLDGSVVAGSQQPEDVISQADIPYLEQIAFEAVHYTEGTPMGVFVKQLEGFSPLETSGAGYYFNDQLSGAYDVRYNICDEIPALTYDNSGYSTIDESVMKNADNVDITARRCVLAADGVEYVDYIFYKPIMYLDEPCYLAIIVMSKNMSVDELGIEYYLQLTRDMYYSFDNTQASPVVFEALGESGILCSGIIAFTIENTIDDDIPAVMAKRLEGWDWQVITQADGRYNEFTNDGVHIRYRLVDTLTAQEIFDTYSYEMIDNASGIPTRAVTIENDPQSPDINTQYVYYMALRFETESYVRDFYMEIKVFDIKGAESGSMGDINTYIDLTTEDFYNFTEPTVMATYIP